jgi:hypothetical protein
LPSRQCPPWPSRASDDTATSAATMMGSPPTRRPQLQEEAAKGYAKRISPPVVGEDDLIGSGGLAPCTPTTTWNLTIYMYFYAYIRIYSLFSANEQNARRRVCLFRASHFSFFFSFVFRFLLGVSSKSELTSSELESLAWMEAAASAAPRAARRVAVVLGHCQEGGGCARPYALVDHATTSSSGSGSAVVVVERQGSSGVVLVRMNRPSALNALGTQARTSPPLSSRPASWGCRRRF